MADVNEQDMATGEESPQKSRDAVARRLVDGLKILALAELKAEAWGDDGGTFDLTRTDYSSEVYSIGSDLRRIPDDIELNDSDRAMLRAKTEEARGGEIAFFGERRGYRRVRKSVPCFATAQMLRKAAASVCEAHDTLMDAVFDNLSPRRGRGVAPRIHAVIEELEGILVEIGKVHWQDEDMSNGGVYLVGEEDEQVWVPEDEPALAVVGGGPET